MTASLLEDQLNALMLLHQVIEEEAECLKNKEFTSLNEVLFNKQKQLQDIATRDSTITATFSLADIENNEQLSTLKKQVDLQLQHCQKLNDINGQLVQLSMKSNKHLMQLMTQATGKNTVTYDKKGTLGAASLLGSDIKA